MGAAIASVSGVVDTIEILEGKDLSETLARIKQQAIDNAVNSGADRATTRIADINVLPVQVKELTRSRPFPPPYIMINLRYLFST